MRIIVKIRQTFNLSLVRQQQQQFLCEGGGGGGGGAIREQTMLSNGSRGTVMSYSDHSVQRRLNSNAPNE